MQFQGKAFRTDKYSVLDAACVQMQFLYDLLVEVGPSLGWENPVLGALSCSSNRLGAFVVFLRVAHPARVPATRATIK